MRMSRPSGPTQHPLPHGHTRMVPAPTMPFLTHTGVGGTGANLSISICTLSWVPSAILFFFLVIGKQLKKNPKKAWKFSKVQDKITTALTKALNSEVFKSWTAMMDAYHLEPSLSAYLFLTPFSTILIAQLAPLSLLSPYASLCLPM